MSRLLTRRWIVMTVLAAAAVAVMAELGFWQLRRLHTVRAENTRIRASMSRPAVPLDSVIGLGARAVYRRVTVTGRFDRVSEIELANRSNVNDGSPGSDLLTPLRPASGPALIVDRGWIPLDATSAQQEQARPPLFTDVTVRGVLFASEKKTIFAPSIAPTGRLTAIPRVDIPRIAKQIDYPVLPLYLRLETQSPAQGELPVPPGLPDLSEGPHFSYAVQWFIFASIATIVYFALLRKQLRAAT